MSEKYTQPMLTGDMIQSSLEKAVMNAATQFSGKNTSETHKSTTTVEVKAKGVTQFNRDMTLIAKGTNAATKSVQEAQKAFNVLKQQLGSQTGVQRATFYSADDKIPKKELTEALAYYSEISEMEKKLEAEKTSLQGKRGNKKDKEYVMASLESVRAEKKDVVQLIQKRISSIAAIVDKEFSIESLMKEVSGLKSFIDTEGNKELTYYKKTDFQKTFSAIRAATEKDHATTANLLRSAQQQFSDVIEDKDINDQMTLGFQRTIDHLDFVSIAQQLFAPLSSSMTSEELQHLVLGKWQEAIKLSSNPKQERGLYLKNGLPVYEDISGSQKETTFYPGVVKKREADTFAHSHSFDSEIDRLRFSGVDIKSLFESQIKQAILSCGDELLTIDFGNMSNETRAKISQTLNQVYSQALLAFGGEIQQKGENNYHVKYSDQMMPYQHNTVADYINAYMRQIIEKNGGHMRSYMKNDSGVYEETTSTRLNPNRQHLGIAVKAINDAHGIGKQFRQGELSYDQMVELINHLREKVQLQMTIDTSQAEQAVESVEKEAINAQEVIDYINNNSSKITTSKSGVLLKRYGVEKKSSKEDIETGIQTAQKEQQAYLQTALSEYSYRKEQGKSPISSSIFKNAATQYLNASKAIEAMNEQLIVLSNTEEVLASNETRVAEATRDANEARQSVANSMNGNNSNSGSNGTGGNGSGYNGTGGGPSSDSFDVEDFSQSETEIQKIISLLEKLATAFGAIDDQSDLPSLLSTLRDISNTLGLLDTENSGGTILNNFEQLKNIINGLKPEIDNLLQTLQNPTFNQIIKLGNDPSQTMSQRGSLNRSVAKEMEKAKDALEQYFMTESGVQIKPDILSNIRKSEGALTSGGVTSRWFLANTASYDQKSAKSMIEYYRNIIDVYREMAKLGKVDISTWEQQFGDIGTQYDKQIHQIDTSTERAVEQLNLALNGDNVKVDGLIEKLDSVIAKLQEIINLIPTIKVGLNNINLDSTTSFSSTESSNQKKTITAKSNQSSISKDEFQKHQAIIESYKVEKQLLSEIYALEEKSISAFGNKEKALLREKNLREQQLRVLLEERQQNGLYNQDEQKKLTSWEAIKKRNLETKQALAEAKSQDQTVIDSYNKEKQLLTEIYSLQEKLLSTSGEEEKALLREVTLRKQQLQALREERKQKGLYDKNKTLELATWATDKRRGLDAKKAVAEAKAQTKAAEDREKRLNKIRKDNEKSQNAEWAKKSQESYKQEKDLLDQIQQKRLAMVKDKSGSMKPIYQEEIDALKKEIELLREKREAEGLTSQNGDKQIADKIKKDEIKYQNELQKDYAKQFDTLSSSIPQLEPLKFVGEDASKNAQKVAELTKRFEELQAIGKNTDWTDTASAEKAHKAITELTKDYKDFNDVLKDGKGIKANEDAVKSLASKIESFRRSNTKLSADEVQELDQMQQKLKDCDQLTLKNVSNEFKQFTERIKEAGRTGESFTTQLGRKFREMATYFMSFASFYRVIGIFKEGLGIIKQLDDALTEMQKVSDNTLSSLQKYQVESYDIANSAGTTGLVIQQSTADFMRLGQSLEEASDSAKNASILMNVSEFDSIADATDSLIAMHAAFDDVAQDDIIDKLNNVGNNYAISTDGLATALQSSASALRTAGNDIDESIAVITAGNQVVQDPSKVGNAARFIALRITGTEEAKEELQNMGEEVDDFVVQTSAKSQQIIQDYTAVASNAFKGVDILDENGNFKSTYQILQEIADVYEEIVETDKKYGTNRSQGLIEALGGKNRANVVASILQSPDVLRSAYESSQNSFGSAEEELEKYKDSISGHIAEIQNKWQQAWANTANRDQINFFIDMGSAIMDLVNKIGLIPSALTALGTVYGIMGIAMKKDTNVITLMTSAFQGLGKTAFTVGEKIKYTRKELEPFWDGDLGESFELITEKVGGHNITWGTVIAVVAAVAAAIYGAKKAYDELSMSTDALVKRNDRLIKEDKEKLKSLQDEKKSYDDNAKALSDLLSRYQEAEVGSEEYYNIRQQIADQFPELITGYDSEGRAIIATNDQIQIQIDKYKELSLAKQEALKDQARENIDREVGKTKTWGVGNKGQESLKELRENRKKLEKDKERIETKWNQQGGKHNVVIDPVLGTVQEQDWDLGTDEEYQQILTDLANVTGQIDEARAQLHESYTLLVGQIDEDNVELINATTGLEQFAEKAELDADTFENAFLKLKYSDLSKEGGITEIFNKLLSPDYTEIDATDYANTMRDYVNQIIDEFNLEDVIKASDVYDAFDISKTQDYINKSFDDIYNAYQANATKLGIDLGEWRKTAKVSDILGFNWQDFASEPAIEQFKTRYKKFFDDLQEESVTSLSSMDFGTLEKQLGNYSKNIDSIKTLKKEISEIETEAQNQNWDLSRRQFGNIDLDSREILKQGKDIATVLGSSASYDGLEIAFSPLLQTGTGKPELLSEQTVDKYLKSLLEKVKSEHPDGWVTEDLLGLDKLGLKIDGKQINSLIAGVGDDARQIGELMHLTEEYRLTQDNLNETLKNTPSETFTYLHNMQAELSKLGIITSEGNQAYLDTIDLLSKYGGLADNTLETQAEKFKAFETEAKTSVANLSTSFTSANTALSEMQKNGNITKDTYDALIAANEKYGDAVVETTSGLQLNSDALKEMQEAEQDVIRQDLSAEVAKLSNELVTNHDNIASWKAEMDSADPVRRLQLQNMISSTLQSTAALQDQITSLQQLSAQLDSTTNRYQAWQDAQSNGEAADQYDSIYGFKDTYKKLYEQGRTGDDSFRAFTSLFTSRTNFDERSAAEDYEWISKFVNKYFTEDDTGAIAMYEAMEKALHGAGKESWFSEDGQSFDVKNYEEFRNIMTDYFKQSYGENFEMTTELLELIGKSFKTFDMGNPLEDGTYVQDIDELTTSLNNFKEEQAKLPEGSKEWKQLQKQIDGTALALAKATLAQEKINEQADIAEKITAVNQSEQIQAAGAEIKEVPVSFNNEAQANATIQQLLASKKALYNEQGELINPEDEATVENINSLLSHCVATKNELMAPAVMSIDASSLEGDAAKFVTLAQELHTAFGEQEIAITTGQGFEEATEKVNSLTTQLQDLDKSSDGQLGLQFNVDTTNLDTMYETLGNVVETSNSDMGGGLDEATKKAQDLDGAVKSAGDRISGLSSLDAGDAGLRSAVSAANNLRQNVDNAYSSLRKIGNMTVSPTIKVPKVSVSTSGLTKGKGAGAQGTAHFSPLSGRADAWGDIGVDKTETALVGELGPEMRVRGSRWELLGENGAEFSDIRRGDIIFNHRQTEELLKHGYINSRGSAFVGGTAYNDITPKKTKTKKTSTKSSNTTKKTNNNNTKSKSNDKDDKKKTSKLQDWLSKLFDWIEVKIDRTQKAIDNAISKAESYVSMIPATLDRITTGANGLFDANRYKETADEVARYVAKAIGQYTNALSSTYSQISTQNQAVTKYESLASTARKKGLSGLSSKNKKTAKKALKILDKDGTIDVSKYNDKVKEVIEGVKQWKDKAIEARAAINDLNDKVRDYVKSLKETVDAQRDAHTSLAEWSVSSVNATFEATNDNNADYSKSRLDLENNQLMVQNKAYAQATSTMSGQVTSIGKTASKVGMYDGLSKKQQKAIKKNTKGKKAYTTALDNAKKAIKAQKEISLSDLDTIQKYNPTVYAKMIAWNEALNQLDITRQEEITAYTQNYNKIAENIVEKYNKMDEATNNDIELYTKQIDNATSDNGKNELLQKQINKSQDLRAHAQSRVVEFSSLMGNSRGRINNFTGSSMRTSKSMTDSDTKIINALFNRIQNTVKNGKAISGTDLNTAFELYRKGYIQASYYKACTDWNISVERLEEAKRAQLLVEETVRQENATRELQKIQNIQQQSENNRQMNEQRKTEANARISKAEAYGHYAKPEDYTAQIEKENSNLQDLIAKREEAQQTLHKAVEVGNIRIGDDEWYEARNVIDGMTNAINETDLSIKNLKNSLRQLNWDIFDDGMKQISKLNTEIDHYMNIISNEEFFDEDDKGNITQYGLAALEANNTSYELHIQAAQKYADELKRINEQVQNGELEATDKNIIERQEELTEKIWDAVEATEADKQAIIDKVRQAYNAQLSALNKSITKYKELKQAEKDAYDYQKKITDQTKNILSLEKQLAAFEANSSAESVATVQKLRADLDEAKQQVKDDQYDMYMSEMNNMLDDLSNNFQEWIDYYMKDRDRVLNDVKNYLAGSIDDLGNRSGMADAITTFRNQAIELIGDTGTDVTNISNNLTPMLEANQSVEEKTKTIKEKVDTIIDDFEKMVAKQNQPLINELKQLVAVAEGETKYRAEQAEAEKRAAEEAKRKEEEARKAAEAAAKKAADDKAKADAEAKAKANAQKTTQKTSSNTTTIASIEKRLADIKAVNDKLYRKQLTGKLTSAEKQTIKNNEAEYAKLTKQLEELKKNTKATATIANLGTKATITAVKATVPTVSGGATAALMSASAKLGYKKGSRRISENQWAWTQEDGTEAIYRKSDNALLTPLGAGDKVFTAGMTDNLWKLAKMNLPEMISNSFKQPIVSNSNTNARTNGGDVQFIFNLPGVKDYDSFKSALIADKNFQNAVQTMTLGAASGKNSLSKFKYS